MKNLYLILSLVFLTIFSCKNMNPLDPLSPTPPVQPPGTNSSIITNGGVVHTNLSRPSGFSATKGTLRLKVGLKWNSVQYASYYSVYRDGTFRGTSTVTTYTDLSASPGILVPRSYYIIAKHATLSSSNSLTDIGWINDLPPIPTKQPTDPSGFYQNDNGTWKTIFSQTYPATNTVGYRIEVYNGGLIKVIGIDRYGTYVDRSTYTYMIYSTNQIGRSVSYISF